MLTRSLPRMLRRCQYIHASAKVSHLLSIQDTLTENRGILQVVSYETYAGALCLDGPTLTNLELLENTTCGTEGSLLARLDTCASPGIVPSQNFRTSVYTSSRVAPCWSWGIDKP